MQTILLGESAQTPTVGRAGENGVTEILTDARPWLEQWPDGAGVILFRRPDGAVYPLTARLAEGYLHAALCARDTAVPGTGGVEAQWTNGSYIKKSKTWEIEIAPSLGEAGSVPEASPSWVDDMAALGVTVEADAAQVAADKTAASGSADDAQAAQIAAAQSATAASVSATAAQAAATGAQNSVAAHAARTDNPHGVTAAQIGAVGTEDYATAILGGVVKVRPGTDGLNISNGILSTYPAGESQISQKTSNKAVITPLYLDYSVKSGLTTNALPMTDAEKSAACGWMGAVRDGTMALIEKIIVGYSLTTEEPADWSTNWTAYYTNTGTAVVPMYTALTGASAPTWVAGTYYAYDAGGTASVARTQQPDGAQYALRAITTKNNYAAGAASNVNYVVNLERGGLSVMLNGSHVATAARYSYTSFFVRSGAIEGLITSGTSDLYSSVNEQVLAPVREMSDNALYAMINSITIMATASGAVIPSGSVIEIWGAAA